MRLAQRLVVVFGLLAAACTTSNTTTLRVPTVIGDNKTEGRATIQNAGYLFVAVTEPGPDNKGTIAAQMPPAGTELAEGETVRVTISSGWPAVPDFASSVPAGMSVEKAKDVLRKRHLRISQIVRRTDTYYSLFAPGRVFTSRPTAPDHVAPGTAVTLVIAKPYACTPGYSACLQPHLDDRGLLAQYDCAGTGGDGPYYVYGTVRVTGDDIYRLDGDHNGLGCE